MGTQMQPIAVVLAGGSSHRFWPLGDKALVRLGELSLIERQLAELHAAGFREIVVVGNDTNVGALQTLLNDAPGSVTVLRQPNAGGMAAALGVAQSWLFARQQTNPLYVTHAHALESLELHRAVLQRWRREPTAGALVARRIPEGENFPGGYVRLSPDGAAVRISGIIEKPVLAEIPPERLATIVAHLHPDPLALSRAMDAAQRAAPDRDDVYEQALDQLFASLTYRVEEYLGPWVSLKYPWHLLDATAQFLAQLQDFRAPGVEISPGASLVGPVYLGPGARILWGAEVQGPTWIGAGSTIGQFASVRQAFIGERTVIGVRSEVNRSYIGDGTTMHAATVLDSVVASTAVGNQGANLSAGVITANLRLDHRPVRSMVEGALIETGRRKLGAMIGAGAFVSIQAGLMPGVKLGVRSIVDPGTIVDRDLADRARVGRSAARRS
jgi:bifunctional UDP-N-acetylglucosamine pyrophosphorylase/glucosamine-1-phosphate N-acetyltransferase